MSPEKVKGYSWRVISSWASAVSVLSLVFVGGMAWNQNNSEHSLIMDTAVHDREVQSIETIRSKSVDAIRGVEMKTLNDRAARMETNVEHIMHSIEKIEEKM